MAALVQGVQYGLSSQGNFNENKTLIFVKLTDSAHRAIEDYLRNKNKTSQHPTIQFLGNEGHLSFPSSVSSHGQAGFKFSLSSNADIEGPQGSFECIQQTSSKSLGALGAMQCKMRIQAKDDVYEATKHRMAVAEENHKKNCTREIKPGGPGIGRRVKMNNRTPPVCPPRRNREAVPLNTPSPLSSSSVLNNKNCPSNTKPPSNGYYQPHHPVMSTGNFAPVSVHTKPQGNNHAQKPGNPDVMRRPLRERLIHLLAMRPYKKPELYDRVTKDGLRERDKNILMTVLKQVSYIRDNTYHLLRHVWNDVQEDWPFYSEQEKQMLKRRKPQNLTPPGSSDGGSSGSGQSPTSTHPGSPPSTISSSNNKRPGYTDGADGLPTKRPRISHYRKPTEDVLDKKMSLLPTLGAEDMSWGRTMDTNPRWNMTVRLPTLTPASPDQTPREPSRELGRDSNREFGREFNRDFGRDSNREFGRDPIREFGRDSNRDISRDSNRDISRDSNRDLSRDSNRDLSRDSNRDFNRESTRDLSRDSNREFNRESNRELVSREPIRERSRELGREPTREPTRESIREPKREPSREPTREASREVSREPPPSNINSPDTTAVKAKSLSEYPEYLTSYTTIRNREQRAQYKADFNGDYSEYRDLHAVVEKVSRRFALLEEWLHRESPDSSPWKQIKNQIIREYLENKHDQPYQEAKRRFQYLHEKLSHIKRLVLEYDSAPGGGRY